MQPFQCKLPLGVQLPLQHHAYYETVTHLYITSTNRLRQFYSVLKFDKDNERLVYFQESKKLTPAMLEAKVNMITTSSTLVSSGSACGIVGFVHFLKGYYCILATKKKRVARIGPHVIYEVQDTVMIPLFVVATGFSFSSVLPAHSDEQRYVEMFRSYDLKRHFFFSYSYDLTNMLQTNMSYAESAARNGRLRTSLGTPIYVPLRTKFIWNEFLLEPLVEFLPDSTPASTPRTPNTKEEEEESDLLNSSTSVCSLIHPANPVYAVALHLIHGAVVQSQISGFAGTSTVTLIARVSKNFAGSRYLKRGLDDWGHVAVHVELEQIVCDTSTLSDCGCRGTFSSFVQMRGSVPLKWHHPTRKPAPPIALGPIDPSFTATRRHFSELFEDYGAPIYVLNLLKRTERKRRELVIADEYYTAMRHMVASMPPTPVLLHFIPFDIRNSTHVAWNEVTSIAEECLDDVDLFVCTSTHARFQSGVVRSNCVDCIDRTNIAQYLVGLHAFGLQLAECRVIHSASAMKHLPEARRLLLQLYLLVGDALAIQYGGSAAVGAGILNRGLGWDSLMNARRLFNNMQVVAQQEMTNLFLGVYRPSIPEHFHCDFKVPRWEPPDGMLAAFFAPKENLPQNSVRLLDISAMESDYYLHVRSIPPAIPESGWWTEPLARNSRLRQGLCGSRQLLRSARPLTTVEPDHIQQYFLLLHDVSADGAISLIDLEEEDEIAGIHVALCASQEMHLPNYEIPWPLPVAPKAVSSCYILREHILDSSNESEMPEMPMFGEREEMVCDMNIYAEQVVRSEYTKQAERYRALEFSDESDHHAFLACLSAMRPPDEWTIDDLQHAMNLCEVPQAAIQMMIAYIQMKGRGMEHLLQLSSYARSEKMMSPLRRLGAQTPGSSRLGEVASFLGPSWSDILRFLRFLAEYPTADIEMYEEYASPNDLLRMADEWEQEDLQQTPNLSRKLLICENLKEHTDAALTVDSVDHVIAGWLGMMIDPTSGVRRAMRIRYVEGEQLSSKMTPTAGLMQKCVTAKDLITWVVWNAARLRLSIAHCPNPEEQRTMARSFLRVLVLGGLLHFVELPTLLTGVVFGRDTVNTEVMDDRSLYRFFIWDPRVVLNGYEKCHKCSWLMFPSQVAEALANVAFQLHTDTLEHRGEKTPRHAHEELAKLSSYLQGVDLTCMTPDMQLSFFANVFNSLYIHSWFFAHLHPAIEYSVLFNTMTYDIAGYKFSLADIKHGILRQNRSGPHMLLPPFHEGDPRKGLIVQNFEPRIILALIDLYVLPEGKFESTDQLVSPIPTFNESFAFADEAVKPATPLPEKASPEPETTPNEESEDEDEFAVPRSSSTSRSILWKLIGWNPQSPSAPPHLCTTIFAERLSEQLGSIEHSFTSQLHEPTLLPYATAARRIQLLAGMEEFGRTKEEVSKHFSSLKKQMKKAASRYRDDMKALHSPKGQSEFASTVF